MAAACWLGMTIAEEMGWRSYVSGEPFPAALIVATCTLLLISVLALRRRALVALVIVGLCIGSAAGGLYNRRWLTDVGRLSGAANQRWDCEVISDSQIGRFGASSDAVASGGACVRVSWGDTAPEVGERVTFFGSLKPPGTDDGGRRMHRAGSVGYVSARCVRMLGPAHSVRGAVAPLRRWAGHRIDSVPGPGGALLSGVVIGDRRRLAGTSPEADFRTTGLTHLVAVSGGHLVVIAALVGALLSASRLPRAPSTAVLIGVLGMYVVVSGVQSSAVRAWLMATVVGVVSLAGRRVDGLAALAWAVVVSLVVWPDSAFDLGLQLSVASVAGLLLFARLTEAWLGAALPRTAGALAGAVGLTLVAQAATLPLTVSTFGMLSLVSPLANLIAGPLVSVVLSVGMAGLCVTAVWPRVGLVVLMVAGAAGNACVDAAGWLARWPHAAVPLGADSRFAAALCAGAAGALWATWPQPRGRAFPRGVLACALVGLVALALGPRPADGVRVVVMDVGQGDAILVRDGPAAVLVDAGPSPESLRTALLRNGVRSLDAVVISHLHDDHAGGLKALAGTIPVRRAYVAAGALGEGGHPEVIGLLKSVSDEVLELGTGQELTVGRLTLQAVSPASAVADAAENDSSVVLLARAWQTEVLLTGDAESEVLERVVGAGLVPDIDVLKVGHHGSASAVSPGSLSALRPEWAIISVGAGNRFGHPTPSTLELLSAAGARVLRTDQGGDVTVLPGPNGCTVESQNRGTASGGYATLGTRIRPTPESHGPRYQRLETRLPDLERAADARGPGAHATPLTSCRGRRPRLQLPSVRGRRRVSRRHHRLLQHDAVCIRSPARRGPGRREALQRRT